MYFYNINRCHLLHCIFPTIVIHLFIYGQSVVDAINYRIKQNTGTQYEKRKKNAEGRSKHIVHIVITNTKNKNKHYEVRPSTLTSICWPCFH